MRRVIVTLVALYAMAEIEVDAAQATYPGANGKIAYSAFENDRLFTVNPDGTDEVQIGFGANPAWSPDGSKIATDGVFTMNADGTARTRITDYGYAPAWSPDGQEIVFLSAPTGVLMRVRSDGTGLQPIDTTGGMPGCGLSPDWSARNRIAFIGFECGSGDRWGIYTADPDGSDVQQLWPEAPRMDMLSWSPGGNWIAASSDFSPPTWLVPTEGPGFVLSSDTYSAAWSPDGTRLVVRRTGPPPAPAGAYTINGAGNDLRFVTTNVRAPAWQPLPPAPAQPGYARPKGATPVYVSLVPAFAPCESSTTTHGAPLSFASCKPPQQASTTLTVGTGDSNGQPVRSLGSLRLDAVPGDLNMSFRITDVRCRSSLSQCPGGPLSDYYGELEATADLRITDRASGGSGTEAATGAISGWLLPFRLQVQCDQTADPAVGSTCGVATTANTLLPGAVQSGRRSVWELDGARVMDSGPDGHLASDDNEVFAVPGLFVP